MRDVATWTGLRGLAALWVVMFHFWPHLDTPEKPPLIAKGYLAVDLFFLLSGFVMYHVYARKVEKNELSWGDYMWKRFARLYPVHLVTTLGAIVILYGGVMLGMGKNPTGDFSSTLVVTLLGLQGMGFLSESTFNYPSWSISAELSAYVIFIPLAVLVLKVPRQSSWLFGVLFFLLYALAFELMRPASMSGPDGTFALFQLTDNVSFLRIWPEFLLGMAVMRTMSGMEMLSTKLSIIVLSAILASMVICVLLSTDVLFVLLGCALIAALYVAPLAVPAPLELLGKISYSLYMVHALVEMVLFKVVERIGGYEDNSVPLWFLPIAIGIAIAAAYFLWRIVEEPCRVFLTQTARRKSIA